MCVDRYCRHVEQKLKGGLSSVLVLYTIGGAGRPIHGYGIIKRIHKMTGGYITVGAGTVYPILRNLEDKGMVVHDAEGSTRGPGRKVYSLTDDGKRAVGMLEDMIYEFNEAVTSVRCGVGLAGNGGDAPEFRKS